MHVRRGHYIGVAPVPGGLTNACLVVPHPPSRGRFGGTSDRGDLPLAQPADALDRYLKADPELSARFANARAVGAADDARADGGGYDRRWASRDCCWRAMRRASSIR